MNRPSTLLARSHFDRDRLPDPARYYSDELVALRGHGVWRDALCPFHKDTKPSLRVNMQTGAYRCFACGASGGDALAFHMARYGQSFKDACRALGAWTGARHV